MNTRDHIAYTRGAVCVNRAQASPVMSRSLVAAIDQALDLGCPGSPRVFVGAAALDDLYHEPHAEHFLEPSLEIGPQLCAIDVSARDLDQHRHLLALLGARALDNAHILAVAAALGGDNAADRLRENVYPAQLHHGVVAPENAIEPL